MVENESRYSLKLRILFILIVGLAPYWFMNATIWIPWVFLSRPIGIIIMILSVPVVWGYGAYYCFKYTPIQNWKREQWLISLLFFLSSAISDVFFFVIWRDLPFEEIYHSSTIASYVLILIIPLIVEKIVANLYTKGKFKVCTNYNWIRVITFVVVFILITLNSVRYW